MYHPGNHIGTAGGGPAAHDQPQADAQEDAAVKRAEQGVICHRTKRQDIDKDRKKHGGNEAAEGKNPAHGTVSDDEERNVQHKGYGADR